MKNLIILSGEACTGKTTVGRALATELGWAFQSAGNHVREFAKEKHAMGIHAFQDLCAVNPEIDRQLDHDFCQKYGNVSLKALAWSSISEWGLTSSPQP